MNETRISIAENFSDRALGAWSAGQHVVAAELAAALVAAGRAEELGPKQPSLLPDRAPDGHDFGDDVLNAIHGLTPGDKGHWTRGGVPDAKVLSEKLGRTVSAADRDAAWALYREATAKLLAPAS